MCETIETAAAVSQLIASRVFSFFLPPTPEHARLGVLFAGQIILTFFGMLCRQASGR
jgi:hypothetical protein